jgi:hypothetical protein
MNNGNDGKSSLASGEYSRVIDILIAAAQVASEARIPKQEFLPALADFTVTVALAFQGEECLRAVIKRMQHRIDDWRNGTFPLDESDEQGQRAVPRSRLLTMPTPGRRSKGGALNNRTATPANEFSGTGEDDDAPR